MSDLLKKAKQNLLYAGLEKEQYKMISAEINEANRKSIVVISSACLLVYALRMCLRYSVVPYANKLIFMGAILLFGMLAFANFKIRNNPVLVHVSACLFMAFYLGVGILSAVGSGSVHERTTLYLVFVVVAPMLYALNAVELAAIIIPAEICYLLLITRFQSAYPVYAANLGNSLFFSITGLMLGVYMANMKVSGIYNTYMNSRVQEIRKLNEELAASKEQLQAALEEAKKASQAKTTFLSNMSHDIRTPMNAIVGISRLLEHEINDPEKQKLYIRKIQNSSQHLLGLINDVLDMSRIESGEVVLNNQPMDLLEQMEQVENIIRPQAEERGQELIIHVSNIAHVHLVSDPLRLRQVFINLLSNAVKYTSRGGKIVFEIEEQPDSQSDQAAFSITVTDNGCGMTPEFTKSVFEPFTRAENSTTNKIQGTGLGLAITKSIVDLMGGNIRVSSEVDKGTCFQVDLRLQVDKKREKEDSRESRTQTAETTTVSGQELTKKEQISILKGKRFLCAEDNELNAEILEAILEMENASCTVCRDGAELLKIFNAVEPGEYDAILMDVQMPNVNGLEATKLIRKSKNPLGKTIPIIAMTANAFSSDVRECMAAGMNGHVAKPLDMVAFERVLRDVLG